MTTETRKRGGQPGNRNSRGHGAPADNRNALKHGIYSQAMAMKAMVNTEGMPDMTDVDELAIAGRRLANALVEYHAARTHHHKLDWEAAIRHYLELISKMKERAGMIGDDGDEVWETMLEGIRAANKRDGLR